MFVHMTDFPLPILDWIELPYEPYPQKPIKWTVSIMGRGLKAGHTVRIIDQEVTYYGEIDEDGFVVIHPHKNKKDHLL